MTTSSNTITAASLVQQLTSIYRQLDLQSLGMLESLYAQDVYFEDPAHAIQGRDALMAYFKSLVANVSDCRFTFHQVVPMGTDLFLSWTMQMQHNRLQGDEPIRVDGASYLKTRNGQIFYHRDYFDLGAMVYENVPVLGAIIRGIKNRLGG